MPKKPVKKKKLGKAELKKTRGGSRFDAFLEIEGIKGETENRSGPGPTLYVRDWNR